MEEFARGIVTEYIDTNEIYKVGKTEHLLYGKAIDTKREDVIKQFILRFTEFCDYLDRLSQLLLNKKSEHAYDDQDDLFFACEGLCRAIPKHRMIILDQIDAFAATLVITNCLNTINENAGLDLFVFITGTALMRTNKYARLTLVYFYISTLKRKLSPNFDKNATSFKHLTLINLNAESKAVPVRSIFQEVERHNNPNFKVYVNGLLGIDVVKLQCNMDAYLLEIDSSRKVEDNETES
jgi:hypothetical protein